MLLNLIELTAESLISRQLAPIMLGIDAGWSSLAARRAHNPKFGAFLMVKDGHQCNKTEMVYW